MGAIGIGIHARVTPFLSTEHQKQKQRDKPNKPIDRSMNGGHRSPFLLVFHFRNSMPTNIRMSSAATIHGTFRAESSRRLFFSLLSFKSINIRRIFKGPSFLKDVELQRRGLSRKSYVAWYAQKGNQADATELLFPPDAAFCSNRLILPGS